MGTLEAIAPAAQVVTAEQLQQALLDLIGLGIRFDLAGDKLQVKGNLHQLSDADKDFIRANKEQILSFIRARRQAAVPVIEPVTEAGNLPLSFAQQRLWLLDQIEGGSSHYHIANGLKLSGALDVARLERAFVGILRRHQSLRSCVAADERSEPYQRIQSVSAFALACADLSLLTEVERARGCEELLQKTASQPFDLSADLMLRAQLIKLAPEQHILAVTLHHIAADGWSMAILINELIALYRADSAQLLPDLPVQYADYAHWQRNWLQGERLQQQLDYWSNQLAGLPQVHSLPLDYPRPARQSFDGAHYVSTISADLTQQLYQACQAVGATLFMGLHAAFSVLLSRYSNERDIVVGSPIANREQAEIAGLIGFFVNTLVLRSDLSGNPSFNDLLNQSKNTLLGAYAHQQVPFEQLVEQLQPERSLSHSALFQIMLVLQNNQQGSLELPGLQLEPLTSQSVHAKYDLTLTATEIDSELSLVWEYNTQLFAPDTIAKLANHFECLLSALLKQPDAHVLALDMLSESERAQLNTWSLTEADYADHQLCIHQLFEAQVAKTPDAVAVTCAGEALTYEQLNSQANQLAQHLIATYDIQPDTLIGLCMPRSPALLVALIAIHKAGGAYVPLDPHYPAARLSLMLEDAQLRLVLTQRPQLATTPITEQQALCLDDQAVQTMLAQQARHNPHRAELRSSHLAYVIYTSGSTGKPKGVMIEHRNTTAFLCWARATFSAQQLSAVLASTSVCFDLSVFELLAPLVVGGRTIMVDNVLALPQLATELSLINTVPSAAEALLAANAIPAGIDTINLAGEPLAQALVERLYAQGFKWVYDLYGPSEDTTYSTYVLRQRQGRASIGRPITNTCAYLLNAAGQLVAPGAAGELHLGGAGLARGYLHRAELTAEKFIANPLASTAPYQRLYKTGDLARWLPNGELEYLGRLDHQVKIRGFRIELGDIEQALLEHPAVAKALVLAQEFGAGDQRLLAYLVTHSPDLLRETLAADLRSHLLARLPDFMLPSVLVPLAEFPLTANGKINRAALPVPALGEAQSEYSAPLNSTEQILCEIWQEVLGLERVGVTDNFFQLGGHSLLLVKMTGLAAYRGLYISVRQAFAAEHIRALAASCVAVADTAEWKSITGPVPIAPNLAYSLAVTSADRDRWLMVNLLQASQPLQAEALGRALALLIARHDALRLSHYQDVDGTWRSEVLPVNGDLPLAIIDCIGLDEAALAERALEARARVDANSNLVTGPLIQLVLLERGEQPSRLLVAVHHYAVDAIAFGLLLQELQYSYTRFAASAELTLPPPVPGYGDYARFIGAYATTPACIAQLDYWQSLGQRVHSLPVDYDNRHLDTWRLREFKTLTPIASLNDQLAVGHGEQVQAAILSALLLAYQRWSGRDYLHLNLVTNGRQLDEPAPDLSHCIGWVSYMNPVLLTLAEQNPVPCVQRQLSAIPRDNSFGILKYCHPDPAIRQRMAQLPEPQMNFNYFAQGTASAAPNPDAGQLSFWPVPERTPAPAGERNHDIVVKPGARLMHYLMLSCDLLADPEQMGQVRMSWMYVPELFADSTINQLAADFASSLKDVMDQLAHRALLEAQPSPNTTGV